MARIHDAVREGKLLKVEEIIKLIRIKSMLKSHMRDCILYITRYHQTVKRW